MPSETLESFRTRLPVADLSRVDTPRHLRRMTIFVALYLAAAAGAVALADAGRIPLAVPLYALAGASLHGLSLFVHEAVHGALARNRRVNRWLGFASAVPVLQTCTAYRVLHLEHHADTGGAEDPDHYANYSARPALQFVMHWARLLFGYPVYIAMIPILGWRHGRAADRRAIVVEVLVLAVVAGAVAALVPGRVLLHAWLLPMIVVHFIVNVRGMSQHTLLDEPEHRIRGTRSIRTDPVTAFFMINENLHLEHHLYPSVPWYNLPVVGERLDGELTGQQAPIIPGYLAFVRDFARSSFRLLGPA